MNLDQKEKWLTTHTALRSEGDFDTGITESENSNNCNAREPIKKPDPTDGKMPRTADSLKSHFQECHSYSEISSAEEAVAESLVMK